MTDMLLAENLALDLQLDLYQKMNSVVVFFN